MNIIVNIQEGTLDENKVQEFEVFDLGQITTTLQDLLDDSTITLNDNLIPILEVTNIDDSVTRYLIKNFTQDFRNNSQFITGQDLLKEDLIQIGGVSSGGVEEAPIDSVIYGRLDGVWADIQTYIPFQTSLLVNDGEDGINPFITAADIPVTSQTLSGNIALLTGNVFTESENTFSATTYVLSSPSAGVFRIAFSAGISVGGNFPTVLAASNNYDVIYTNFNFSTIEFRCYDRTTATLITAFGPTDNLSITIKAIL